MPHQAEYQYVAEILNLKKTLIPVPPHQLAQLSDPDCLICRDEAEDPVELPCSCRYVFCRNCITLALAGNDACPTCQTAIMSFSPWKTTGVQLLAHASVELRFFLRAPHLALYRAFVGGGSLSWAEMLIAAWAFNLLQVHYASSSRGALALLVGVCVLLLRETVIAQTLFDQYDRLTPRRGLLERASFRGSAQLVELCLSTVIWTASLVCVIGAFFISFESLIVGAGGSSGGDWWEIVTTSGAPERYVSAILGTAVVQTMTRSVVLWLAHSS